MVDFVKVVLAAALVVHLACLVSADKNPVLKRARRQGNRYPAHIQQGCSTACQNRGYRDGCCDITENSCFNSFCSCYCDLSCHSFGDCCNDINTIGCPMPGQGRPAQISSSLEGTCSNMQLANGTISYSPNQNSRGIGTIASLQCNEGFGLVPAESSVRVCGINFMWSGPEPACRELCDVIDIENGMITYEQSFSSPRKPARTVAIYSCNPGYSLFGVDRRVCQGSQGWSKVLVEPRCEVVSCMIQYPDTGGCPPNLHNSLLGSYGNPKRCSCDLSCFRSTVAGITNNDACCEDVACAPTTCGEASLSQGCCSWSDLPTDRKELTGCYVPGGGCYCDAGCKAAGDCCTDVPAMPTCTASAARQSQVRGQSVRTMPFGRAQLARGGRTQASMEDQEAKNLASELMSMSQEQVDKRHRWEVITKELEAMKKNKY